MISENEVKERIKELESMLDNNEKQFYSLNNKSYTEDEIRRKIMFQCYNIESQLEALYYVLEKEYIYRH